MSSAQLTALLTDVYSITGRPDREADTVLAIKQATLKAHHSDYYPRDRLEKGFSFQTAAYIHSLDYKALVPQYRALNYLRKADLDTTQAGVYIGGAFIEVLSDPSIALDSYQVTKLDVVYLAGEVLQIRTTDSRSTFIIGAYINPVLTTAGFNSWIAADFEYVVIYEAARLVFKGIGKDDEAAAMERLKVENLALLKAGALLAQGF